MSEQQTGAKISSEQIEHLKTLIDAVNLAQRRGAFHLNEAERISKAVRAFVVQSDEPAQENTTENTETTTPKVI